MKISAARRRKYLEDALPSLLGLVVRMMNLDANDWLDRKKKKRRRKAK